MFGFTIREVLLFCAMLVFLAASWVHRRQLLGELHRALGLETVRRTPVKFSIRELLLTTLIVALALGWWLDRRRLIVELDKARDEAKTAWHALGHSP